MEKERAEQIIAALQRKGVDLPCPRCGHTAFDVVGEPDLLLKEGGWVTSSEVLPTALIACRWCGFLCRHALRVLLEPPAPAVADTGRGADAARVAQAEA